MKVVYFINNTYDKNNIHDNDINNISKFNLLHNIFNTSKCIKTLILVIRISYMGV